MNGNLDLFYRISAVIFFLYLVMFIFWLKKRLSKKKQKVISHPEPIVSNEPDTPKNFGKHSWMAFKNTTPENVIKILDLKNAKIANWESGLNSVQQGIAFISPSINGWVFLTGHLLDYDDLDNVVFDLKKTSKEFGVSCYFLNYPISNSCSWAIAIDGFIKRMFVYADGEISFQEGDVTEEEKNIFKRAQSDDGFYIDEEDIFVIAEKWSLDPSTLETLNIKKGTGYIAYI